MPVAPDFAPSQRHADLGEAFYDLVRPAAFPTAIIRHRDQAAAASIGLDSLTNAEWVACMARFEPLPGSFAQPLALRYHGHQFRNYNPDLGDGRGFLYAQMHDREGRLLDLGTKGSGTTPWSRAGDGRLTLKGGVREVLATELLAAQGVTTSRSLSLVETGEDLVRHDEPSPTRSAVLVRLNHSHIRIGSFQRPAYLHDEASLRRLLDYTIQTYMPAVWRETEAERAVAFLAEVTGRVARLGAQWMLAGFVHGVLNTDNINVTGESFDYGPWRWLPTYDPAFTAAYFDENGLYAYGRQPDTLLWNLTRLAECLLPLADREALVAVLHGFAPAFQYAYEAALLRRLGVARRGAEADAAVSAAWWRAMADSQAPFEQALFDWYGGRPRAPYSPAFYGPAFDGVRAALAGSVPAPGVRLDHPYFAGKPCTMLIDEVEALWAPIALADDWSAFHAKLAAIQVMADAYRAD